MILLKLFWSFFIVGLFSFGGGYAAMPFIQEQVVELNGWLTINEFVDVVTISQMTPGPIGINAATFVGMKVSGIPGAVMATIGFVAPSCVIVITLAYLYFRFKEMSAVQSILKGLRPAVVSLIAVAGFSILQMALLGAEAESWLAIDLSNFDFVAAIAFAAALFILRKFKIDPIFVMLGSGVVGLVTYYIVR